MTRFAEFWAGAWALLRPLNCAITAVSVGVGALTSGVCADLRQVAGAAFSAALIAAAGNIYNDLKDLEIDRINRPRRPLPSGRIGKRAAAIEMALLASAGWLLSWWLGPHLFAIASGVVLGLFVYSSYLKSTVLWGNLTVSLLAAAAFPFGALAAGSIGRSWLPAAFAFLFHLAREIIKDVEDAVGDRRRGVATLALFLGPKGAAGVATALFVLLMGVTLAPWALNLYGLPYLIVIAVLDALLITVVVKMIRGGAGVTDQRLSQALMVGMILGLLAIVLGESL